MAMGLVSDEELEKELARNGTREIKVPAQHGRSPGDVNVPESLRRVIAQDAIENGRQSAMQLAESVGVSPSSVSAYSNGATSTASYNTGNKDLINHTNVVKEKIAGRARGKLLAALREITPEKLKSAKLKDVSSVARNMSAIVRDMEPQRTAEDEGRAPKVNINIFAPARKQESEYDVIEVQE